MKVNPTDLNHGITGDPMDGFEPWVRRFIGHLPDERRSKVLEFIRDLQLDGDRSETISRYMLAIRTLGTDGKPYEGLDREDLTRWLIGFGGMRLGNDGHSGYSESTQFLIKHHVKRFLRYAHTRKLRTNEKPEVLECIRYRPPKSDFRKEILSPEEIRRLVDAAGSQRDRALLFVGYESGARAGELLSLRIRDVRFDEYGAVCAVSGKTGSRRIRLIESVPDLQLWLNQHPNRKNRDAPLWPGRRRDERSIGVKRLFRLVQSVAKHAGIEKHVHPHLLRHSRATHLANVFTDAQMREFFGWTKASKTPSIYVHLSGRDTDRTLLKHYGIEQEEKARGDTVLKPVECPRCHTRNPPGAKFCNRCSMVMDDAEAIELDSRLGHAEAAQELVVRYLRQHMPEILEKVLRQPEIREELAKMV